MTVSSSAAATLVGRADWLDALSASLDEAAPVRWWWYGTSGSGKSRLLEAAAELGRERGLSVLVARGLGEDAAPYQALGPWLAAILDRRPASAAALAPVLAGEAPGLRDAFLLLAQEAFAGPALWLLDDAELLDPPSRALLEALASLPRPWAQVVTAAVGAPDGARELPLKGLGEEDLLGLAARELGSASLPPEVIERLPMQSGGLPGRVGPILRHWQAVGDLLPAAEGWQANPEGDFAVPYGLASFDEVRFQLLSEPARQLVRAAALLREGEVELLETLLGSAGFLELLGEAEGWLVLAGARFRYPSADGAVLLADELPAATARAWRSQAAGWLAARSEGPERTALPTVLAIARLLLEGDRPHDALPWVLAGAGRALALDGGEAAIMLLDAALGLPDLTDEDRLALDAVAVRAVDPDGAMALYEGGLLDRLRHVGGQRWVEHLVHYGRLLQGEQRTADARRAFAQAINAAEGALAVEARLLAAAADPASAATLLGAAVRRARELPDTRASRLLLVEALTALGPLAARKAEGEGLAMLDEAQAIAEALAAVRPLAATALVRAELLLALGRPADAVLAAEQAAAAAGRLGDGPLAAAAQVCLAAALLEQGEPAQALARARAARALRPRQGLESRALSIEGLALIATGEPGPGLQRTEAALALVAPPGDAPAEAAARTALAQALALMGRFEDAREAAAAARRALQGAEGPTLERLELTLAVLENAQDAGERLLGAVELARRDRRPAVLVPLMTQLAAWRLRLGQSDQAERVAQEAMRHARQLGLPRWQIELGLILGRAERALQHDAQGGRGAGGAKAAAHLRSALDLAEARGDALSAAVARAEFGRLTRDPAAQRAAQATIERMIATLDPHAREAFLRYPERRLALLPFTSELDAAPRALEAVAALEAVQRCAVVLLAEPARGPAAVLAEALALAKRPGGRVFSGDDRLLAGSQPQGGETVDLPLFHAGKPRGLLQLDGPPVAPARLATLTRLAELLAAAMAGYEAAGGTEH